MQKEVRGVRKLMWFTIGFGIACAVGTYLWTGSRIWAAVFLFAGIALHFLKDNPYLRRISAVCLGFSLGMAWFLTYDAAYTQPIRELDGEIVELELTTCGYSWETDYGSAVDCCTQIDGKQYKVRVYLNKDYELEPWTNIRGSFKLRLTTDGGLEEPTFHRSNGILALCYQRTTPEFSPGPESKFGAVVTAIANIQLKLQTVIENAFPKDVYAFAKGLLLGDKTDISYEMNTDFKVSGISHIVAVSGLHMSILFALVCTVTSKRRYLLAALGIPSIVLFMALAGFTPSVTRAGIMEILMILSLCVNREYDPPTALAFAALAMLIANPLVSSSVGFQLSVGSVAGIFLFMKKIQDWILKRIPGKKNKRWNRIRNRLASGVAVTLSAQVITTPLVAYYYSTVSLVSIVTNLAVLWIISFLFYGVMAVCLLGLFSIKAAGVLAWLVAWPIRFVTGTAHVLASLPLAAVYTESDYIVIWLALCYAMIIALILGKNKRPLVSLCVGTLGLSLSLALSWAEPMLTDARVTVLDVGQGQCIILQSRDKTFVVDCGGDYGDDVADSCAQTLLSMGIRRIDGLILTHYDADHTNGAASLLTRVNTDALYLPPAEGSEAIQTAAPEAQVIWVETDLLVEAGGMEITLFASEAATSDNESSIAVLFQTEKCDTLITGDMSQLREKLLLTRTQLPELEVLIVGHHGSKNSTSAALLEVTTPEVAIISAGENNQYGHPAQEALERLKAAGCAVYRTDQSGDIVYRR